jgi:hypothetical protein
MPWTLHNLPNLTWKSRFVRALIWAKPERVNEIGLIIYRSCDSTVYAALADEIPEIRPRGDPVGYQRKY